MKFYDRYINGETEQVYRDIYALGEKAFLTNIFPEVEAVMIETFNRVSYNLEVIYAGLKNINYQFYSRFESNSQKPLVRPLPDTELLLAQLDSIVQPFGFVPLSLKHFYRMVGACNFGWDYGTNQDFIWNLADPLQIISLDDLVAELSDVDGLGYLTDTYREDGFGALELSGDYYHKDNISGGPPYSIQLSKNPSMDGKFLHEENNTTFIGYLRICFENCGFSRITNPENKNDYQAFFDKVKPMLRPI